MATVGDLTTFILGAFKTEEDGRVSLYHFLKNFYPIDAVVKPETINEFFSEALQHHHWQEKKDALYTDIQEVLQRFYSQAGEAFRLDLLLDLTKCQLVGLQYNEILSTVVREHEQSLSRDGETVRVMPEGETRVLSVRRTNLGEVVVRTYNNLVRINGSRLTPLCPDQEVFYDPGMELKRGMFQKLRPGQSAQVRFMVESGPDVAITAQFVSGFAFRQTQALTLANISQEPRIFFPLKRLERFYIYRPSDPYYMELISTMERALLMLQTRREEAYDFARQAFDGGQIAFDQIFPDDKALYSRLRELAKWISSPAVRSAYEKTDSQPEAQV